MSGLEPNVCVFSSSLFLTVSIEKTRDSEEADELHLHPGGQGFWVARMLDHLGERAVVVAPVGGESGKVLRSLAPAWGVRLLPVEVAGESPGYVHDRRSGKREEIARSRMPKLDRHEVDDLYGRVLQTATTAGMCVVCGRPPGDSLAVGFYERLGADLKALGARAIGDLHGDELASFLQGGPLHALKVSDDDLVEDGALGAGASIGERVDAARRLLENGAERVILSSADGPTLMVTADAVFRTTSPKLKAADHRGAGDSMTAGLVHATLHGMDATRTIRLACAAGAAAVTRHGVANADADLVRSLADRVAVERL